MGGVGCVWVVGGGWVFGCGGCCRLGDLGELNRRAGAARAELSLVRAYFFLFDGGQDGVDCEHARGGGRVGGLVWVGGCGCGCGVRVCERCG